MPTLNRKEVIAFLDLAHTFENESIKIGGRIQEIVGIIIKKYGITHNKWDWCYGTVDDGGSLIDSLDPKSIHICVYNLGRQPNNYQWPDEISYLPIKWLYTENEVIEDWVSNFIQENNKEAIAEAARKDNDKANKKALIAAAASKLTPDERAALGLK